MAQAYGKANLEAVEKIVQTIRDIGQNASWSAKMHIYTPAKKAAYSNWKKKPKYAKK